MARKTDVVTLPSSGQRVTIRQLGGLQVRASKLARRIAEQTEHAARMVAFGGPEAAARAFKVFHTDAPKVEGDTAPVVAAVPPLVDPMDEHDPLTVMVCGLPSFTREQIDDLDEIDMDFVCRAILALSPAPRTEEQEKNVVVPFTTA